MGWIDSSDGGSATVNSKREVKLAGEGDREGKEEDEVLGKERKRGVRLLDLRYGRP